MKTYYDSDFLKNGKKIKPYWLLIAKNIIGILCYTDIGLSNPMIRILFRMNYNGYKPLRLAQDRVESIFVKSPKIKMKGGVSVDKTQKIGLGLITVDLAVLITIAVIHPVITILALTGLFTYELKS